MATTVYNEEVIALQDGTEVKLKPLAISPLRRFMKVWEGFKDINPENENESLDIFVTCAGIAIEKDFVKKFDKTHDVDGLTEEYRTYLEDVLDMDTIYKILDVCGGLKLNDPELLAAAQAKMTDSGGTN